MRRLALAVLAAAATAACDAGTDRAADAGAQPTDPSPAALMMDVSSLDTVVWATEAAALDRGEFVFRWACVECHGPEGRGDGGYVLDGDTIHPPSFRVPEWRLADDPAGLRRKVLAGNNRGMPHWGERQMQARDVVAVELFIRKRLRAGD